MMLWLLMGSFHVKILGTAGGADASFTPTLRALIYN